MNYLHDLESGEESKMTVIIEVPKGSKNKYEIDKETGLIALDRVYHSTQDMPFDYGFVPQTLWDDGDALDVIVLTTHPLNVGIMLKVRPVGIMNMIDTGESDAKIIAVPVKDARWTEVQDLKDVNKHTLKEMEHYFSTYKNIEGKVVTINGFGGKDEAVKAFHKSKELYKESRKK